jgi:AAA family ATP:ADP antiporter
MASSDPYPMVSEEAARLQGSSTTTTDWNTMETTTSTQPARSSHNQSSSTSEAQFIQKKNHQSSTGTGDNEDIYKNIDDENVPKSKSEQYLESEDEYFDNPMNERLDNPFIKFLKYIHHKLYGDSIPISQLLKTLCLSSTLFFMIGGYWLLRSLKDPVLSALCGVTAIPKAKMLSVVIVLFVVSIYNKLLDSSYKKHTLFYIFGMVYFVIFTVISILLKHPTIGLPNQVADYSRVLGWISYCSIESFGSVMVSLFWSFTNSNFDLESAKSSYGLLVAAAQIGSILGPTLVNKKAESWGVANVYFAGAISMLLLQGCMWMYVSIYGTNETGKNDTSAKDAEADADAADGVSSSKGKKKKAGVLEGIHLFIKHNYVKGIFAISCLFMVEVTIIDYSMKVLAKDYFSGLHPCVAGESCWDYSDDANHGLSTGATAAFTTFMGLFGQATNTLSFLLSFFGTSAIIRYLGLRLVLLLFPTMCLIVIVIVRLFPTLYVVFAAMMILKANSYALNNPTKEMLYQPTSSSVRYKAKSWIDIFGARGSKALGSVVTNAFSDSTSSLIENGSIIGMMVASFLIWNARYMGRTFEQYVASGYVVGEDEDEDDNENSKHMALATGQNEGEDTSCAIYEDEKEIKENVSDHLEQEGDADNEDGEQVEMV